MPDTNERVMAMVEQELRSDPDISNEALRAKAEKLDDAVARMSARQFNATYPLQVKRKLTPGTRRGGRKTTKGGRGRKAGARRGAATGTRGRRASAKGGAKRGRAAAAAGGATIRAERGRPRAGSRGGAAAGNGARGRVRATLLDFARDLANADGAGLVDVIAGVDGYVERVMKAAGSR